MELQIITFYCLADDVLKSSGFHDDPQSKFTSAEVMTVALTAAYFFQGHQRNSLLFLLTHRYLSSQISEGRFNRKLHCIPIEIWERLFAQLTEYFKQHHDDAVYVVDSFPISSCDNIRIFNTKRLKGEKYRGYTASKKRYFYGIRVHMLATMHQQPVEFMIAPGSVSDVKAMKEFSLDLPAGVTVYADKAYTDYEYEDLLLEQKIFFKPQRKKGPKKAWDPCTKYVQNYFRKSIETTFSKITRLFPKSIHAVTSQGFVLKIILFILSYTISLIS